ncbi:MAG: PspC domain-containing protein [Odoribacteraceae bacterium]|jgi:phage shock protein C|nr:PspC domain-containing protein [Odoribacteraceae bacterium]
MKKVVVVHLANKVFHMEEEAFLGLQQAINGQWQRNELEARVADILEQRLAGRDNVVSLEDVNEALERVGLKSRGGAGSGNGNAAGSSNSYAAAGNFGSKKLYRDPFNKVLGGVCGGLGKYLEADPVLLRALFLCSILLASLGIWFYLALWIIVPKAPAIP